MSEISDAPKTDPATTEKVEGEGSGSADANEEEWRKFLEPPKESITTSDLQTCCAIIQMASKAGVITPGDFTTVGALYEKLTAFVSHMRAIDYDRALKEAETEKPLETVDEEDASETNAESSKEEKKD